MSEEVSNARFVYVCRDVNLDIDFFSCTLDHAVAREEDYDVVFAFNSQTNSFLGCTEDLAEAVLKVSLLPLKRK